MKESAVRRPALRRPRGPGILSRTAGLTIACALLAWVPAQATTTLTLDRAFVEANTDRARIEGTFLVDFAHNSAKPKAVDARR